PTISFEAALRPTARGEGLRLALVARLAAAREGVRVSKVDLRVPTDAAGAPASTLGTLMLTVDGTVTRTVAPGTTTVALSDGPHAIAVRSTDDRYGSPEQLVSVARGSVVDLPLWPQRALHGHVRVDARPAEIPPGFSLDRMSVMLQPSGQTAAPDAEGAFAFPRQPIDPASTLTVDMGQLRGAFAPREPLTVGDADDIVLVLVPTRRIEQTVRF
ncbi:MAG: hypothetical protein JO103_10030, partial [Candidatus Eremiobacteraeota bacterium]|nr:hypothetical protein [Candidatus Eremiobacteraeota bacterium]